MTKPQTAGLHLRLPMATLGDEPARYHIEAPPDEREALRQRFGVRQLSAMTADLSVARL